MDGRNTGRMGFSHAAEDSAENMMAAVKAGKIRKHLMGNTRRSATEQWKNAR